MRTKYDFDFAILAGCFGDTKISPTDIDLLVERKNKFLVIEFKSDGAKVPNGQRWSLEALSRIGGFTVLIVWGHPPSEITAYEVVGRVGKESHSSDDLRSFVSRWFEYADAPP